MLPSQQPVLLLLSSSCSHDTLLLHTMRSTRQQQLMHGLLHRLLQISIPNNQHRLSIPTAQQSLLTTRHIQPVQLIHYERQVCYGSTVGGFRVEYTVAKE